jgi:glycosyltransferase involved in cell wall biosynthesis
VLAAGFPRVVVVDDGSTRNSFVFEQLRRMPQCDVLAHAYNLGKGRALKTGLNHIALTYPDAAGVLTMDADGQHPAASIAAMMAASRAAPEAMILGRPVFDASAPLLRVRGRRISNAWTNLETLGAGIADSLYGFRVYPIAPLVEIMRGQRWMRRFDFDTEAVVRLAWRGVRPVNIDAPVKYLRADEGGVSHFRYGRDNALLTWMHLRLLLGFALRLPLLAARRFAGRPPFARR